MLFIIALDFASTGALASEVDAFWDAFTGGAPHLDARARMELADFDGKKKSQAFTLRTRVGYTTGVFHGASVHTDLENISAIDDSTYFDAVSTKNPNNRSSPGISREGSSTTAMRQIVVVQIWETKLTRSSPAPSWATSRS